jgi:hypothetical protein
VWAQNYLQAAVNTYQEITPSGEGVRIWGIADGNPLNRKFTLKIEGKDIAAELFRKTNKALTITGYTLDPAIRELSNIDKVFDWAVVWGERRKAAAAAEQAPHGGNGFDSSGCKYTIDDVEQIVREGLPAGATLAWLPGPFLRAEIVPAALERVSRALAPGGWLVFSLFASPPSPLGEAVTTLKIIRNGGYPWKTRDIENKLRGLHFEQIESFSVVGSTLIVGKTGSCLRC